MLLVSRPPIAQSCSPQRNLQTVRDASPLAAEYARGIATALDEYQLSPAGGLVAACILEPVLQVLSCSACACYTTGSGPAMLVRVSFRI